MGCWEPRLHPHFAFTGRSQFLTKPLRGLHYPIYADYIKLTRMAKQGKQGGTGPLNSRQYKSQLSAQPKTAHIQAAEYPIYAAYASSVHVQNRDTKGGLMQKWDNKFMPKANTMLQVQTTKLHVIT